jgi:hypothetical protein
MRHGRHPGKKIGSRGTKLRRRPGETAGLTAITVRLALFRKRYASDDLGESATRRGATQPTPLSEKVRLRGNVETTEDLNDDSQWPLSRGAPSALRSGAPADHAPHAGFGVRATFAALLHLPRGQAQPLACALLEKSLRIVVRLPISLGSGWEVVQSPRSSAGATCPQRAAGFIPHGGRKARRSLREDVPGPANGRT